MYVRRMIAYCQFNDRVIEAADKGNFNIDKHCQISIFGEHLADFFVTW
jgi:polyphosphate kinase